MTTYTNSTTVTVPADGTYDIKCWGGGAGANGPSGGGGGAFARETSLSVTAGQVLTLTVGAGGASGSNGGDTSVKIGATTHCLAKGAVGATGGATSGCVGDTKRAGGNGGAGAVYIERVGDELVAGPFYGYGGGGGGAGTNQAGSAGSPGTATSSGGVNGAGGSGGSAGGGNGGPGGSSGLVYGGGGGGNTGAGAKGKIELTFTETAPPVISTAASQSVNEDQTLSVELTANETVTWSLVGGADQARFELSGSTLRWLSNGTKDFETPDDADTNNVYVVTVRATDASAATTDKTISVTVLNVAEGAGTAAKTTIIII